MSASTTLLDRIQFIREELQSDLCKDNPRYAKYLEEEKLPELQLEYISRFGRLPERKIMNLATLKQSPHGTKMDLPVTVVAWEDYVAGQHGPWCKMTVSDESGKEEILYGAGKDQQYYPEMNSQHTMRLTCKHKGEWRNLTGYIIQGQPANSSPPSPSPSPSPAMAATPPMAASSPANPQPASTPPAGPAKPMTEYDKARLQADEERQRLIIAQCAAKIAADLFVAGKTGSMETKEVIQFWAQNIWDVGKSIGDSPGVDVPY